MQSKQVRQKFLQFYQDKGHAVIPPSPLVPKEDPTTLFTGSGMQQLVPYLKGEPHPMGKRLVDSQPSFRAEDIEEVGDNRHTTFFEMLGNWSLGDYFKKEQLPWMFELYTQVFGLDQDKLFVSVFEGNEAAPRDQEAIDMWQQLFNTNNPPKKGSDGFDPETKVYLYGADKNWWSRSGKPENMPAGEPGGTTSEIFYLFEDIEHDSSYGPVCHINCDCGRFMEIGNSVFMEYLKQEDGSFSKLPKKNIDFGGGFERIVAVTIDSPDVFETDLFRPVIDYIVKLSGIEYEAEKKVPMRIIADHLRGSALMIAQGTYPSNKMQGYVLRRLLRRAIMAARELGVTQDFLKDIVPMVAESLESAYPEIKDNQDKIQDIISQEEAKFKKAIERGKREIEKNRIEIRNKLLNLGQDFEERTQLGNKLISKSYDKNEIAELAFNLFQTYGVPLEISLEEFKEIIPELEEEMTVDDFEQLFNKQKEEHAQKSRQGAEGMFKGGLADHSETVTQYHTATHLLHQALREVLGEHVKQMGSNITQKRLRFDFEHPQALTKEEIEKIEALINQKIKEDLPVQKTIENKKEALDSGALAFFKEKYPEKVSVYTIGKDPHSDWYSKELCGGPHVSSTGEIPPVTIKKEQSVGAAARRVYIEF